MHLSWINILRISNLTSQESQRVPLNPFQCRSMSSKLLRSMENVEGLLKYSGNFNPTLTITALENLHRVSEKAKGLVENCCSEDWCQASVLQIQNEDAFKEILLERSFRYNTIFELAKDNNVRNSEFLVYEDLRFSSIFDPPTSDEVTYDQIALIARLNDFIKDLASMTNISKSLFRKQYLAKHLLTRLNHARQHSNTEDAGVINGILLPDGEGPDGEWSKESTFLVAMCARQNGWMFLVQRRC